MYKKVGTVYSTTDYDSFAKLEGNRDVLENRKNLIKASIEERGWIRNPIVVNEKMQIIDGQGRFEALKELGLPIEYVISMGATIDDCIALNIKQKNWAYRDYVSCYAQMGNPNYVRLQELTSKHNKIPEVIVHILSGRQNHDSGGTKNSVITGTFEIYKPESVEDRCEFFEKCYEIIGKSNGRTRTWAWLIKFVFFCEKIDNNFFLERLSKYRSFLFPCVTIKQALECCEKIYNYTRKKNYVYFIPEFDAWLETLKTGD